MHTTHRIKKELSICQSSLCLDLVSFPVLSQFKPQVPLLVVPFRQNKLPSINIIPYKTNRKIQKMTGVTQITEYYSVVHPWHTIDVTHLWISMIFGFKNVEGVLRTYELVWSRIQNVASFKSSVGDMNAVYFVSSHVERHWVVVQMPFLLPSYRHSTAVQSLVRAPFHKSCFVHTYVSYIGPLTGSC